jgi:conjugative transfer signal peptidase TraF
MLKAALKSKAIHGSDSHKAIGFVGFQTAIKRLWLAGEIFVVLFIFLFASVQGIKYAGFRINMTDSMPKGIYHFNRFSPSTSHSLKDGSTVLIAQDSSNPVYMMGVERGYDVYGVDLIKKVIGVQGDEVTVDHHTLKVCQGNPKLSDGVCYELPCKSHDNKGLPLNCSKFQGKIPKGKVFVYGESSDLSFDSRYFGLIDRQNIKGIGGLVWQW